MSNNHDYNTPRQGEQDWHVPLNDNFEQLDIDVEIRDADENITQYQPEEGAKFLATDTGIVYQGDGSVWKPILSMAYYDEDGTPMIDGLDVDGEVTHNTFMYETDELSQSIGVGAHAIHNGAVVIADSKNTQFWSKGPDEVRSQMPIYAPEFNTTSTSAAKTAVEPVDPKRALAGVVRLDINTWEFTEFETGRHMGPMAEDFHETFGLSDSDDTIASVDADGVSLAAIQGVTQRMREHTKSLEAENERLRDKVGEVMDRVDKFENANKELWSRLGALEDTLDMSPDTEPTPGRME